MRLAMPMPWDRVLFVYPGGGTVVVKKSELIAIVCVSVFVEGIGEKWFLERLDSDGGGVCKLCWCAVHAFSVGH